MNAILKYPGGKWRIAEIILSGYDNDLYNSELFNWVTTEKETIAQMGLHRTEKLWMNFELNLFQL